MAVRFELAANKEGKGGRGGGELEDWDHFWRQGEGSSAVLNDGEHIRGPLYFSAWKPKSNGKLVRLKQGGRTQER